jgi:membrane-bound lytic murein transglycosylase B
MRVGVVLIAGLSAVSSATAGGAGSYADRPEVQEFISGMATRHGFDPGALTEVFRQSRFLPGVVRAILPPSSSSVRSWRRYRARYIDPVRITEGIRFWQRNEDTLAQAGQRYGVPPEVIVAIIGVETVYGRLTGDFQVFSALATLAFDYPPRADLFRQELEELLLLARERHRDPLDFHGSFAGALGIPQFLPSSYRRYAVDFDEDGQTDLSNSEQDAIGSVGNFLHQHGWQPGAQIAVPATVSGYRFQLLVDGSVEPRYSAPELVAHGIDVEGGIPADEQSALIDLVTPRQPTEYWLGFRNFFVLTRYNRSGFYAMAVFQLSEELRLARGRR